MADTTVTDINTITKTGASTSKYDRSLTAASDGTAVASADTAVIPGYNPETDTLLLCVSAATPTVTVSVNANNKAGRTNALSWTAATGVMNVIPPGALAPELFVQDVGTLRLSVSTGNIYVTVLRCPR